MILSGMLENVYWILCYMISLWNEYFTLQEIQWPFSVLRLTLNHIIPIAWFLQFWTQFGRANLEKLLVQSQSGKKLTQKEESLQFSDFTKRGVTLGIICISCGTFVYFRFFVYLVARGHGGVQDILCVSVSAFLNVIMKNAYLIGTMKCVPLGYPQCTFGKTNNGTMLPPHVRIRDWRGFTEHFWESWIFLLLLPHKYVRFGFIYLQQFLAIFCVVGAFAVNVACNRFVVVAFKIQERYAQISRINIPDRSNLLGDISKEYGSLLEIVGRINKIFGNLLFVYFIYFFPYTAEVVFEWIDEDFRSGKTYRVAIREIISIGGLPFALLVAARGSKKVKMNKK